MPSIIISAPAKINLYLDVTSRRADGYHEIISVMQTVSLCDEICIDTTGREGIELLCDAEVLPTDQRNIAYRAADAFFNCVGFREGIRISIKKSTPISAGLAGGSTDGAAVLRGLNRLYRNPLSEDGLCRLAAGIGADVPFCVRGGCAECRGIGEILSPLPTMPDADIVIACPEERISTPAAYGALDSIFSNFTDRAPDLSGYHSIVSSLAEQDVGSICERMYNIFELTVADRADIADVKRIMRESGAVASMMSGSGPSVFGVFCDRSFAVRTYEMLREKNYSAFICRPTGQNTI